MWDNHEFSWKGWQTQEDFGHGVVPAQTRKVAAAQAWYEYQPARAARVGAAGGGVLKSFHPPTVSDRPLDRFDAGGLGLDPDNLAAIHALTLYRTFRWGRHVELIITDQRSYRSQDVMGMQEAAPLYSPDFPGLVPEEAVESMDAGRIVADFKTERPLFHLQRRHSNRRRDACKVLWEQDNWSRPVRQQHTDWRQIAPPTARY